MALLDEWVTEWVANKYSDMKNVEIQIDSNGFFKIKTSHGYDGSNIMNLLELTYGTDTLIDLLTGLSYTQEQRKQVVPLIGFHKMNKMFDNSVLTDSEKSELTNQYSKYIKNPNITIALINLISQYNNQDTLESSNLYLRKMMDLILRTYYQKFSTKLNLCDSPQKMDSLCKELRIIQYSIMWNEDLSKIEENEYYRIYKTMIEQIKGKSQVFGNNISDLEKTPQEMLIIFKEAENRYGHAETMRIGKSKK